MSVTRQVVRILDKQNLGGTIAAATLATGTDSLQDLMVFNLLLNSRADNGLNYWVNNGWGVDASKGVTGPASFSCVGASGLTKTLTQTVTPGHRDAYSLSLKYETVTLVKGTTAKVGVEVIVRYTDGTSDTTFLTLA